MARTDSIRPHGRIARQLWAGLAGPLIIESPLDRMPELDAADGRVLVLKDLAFQASRSTPHRASDWGMCQEGDLIVANGAVGPMLSATAATLRLRLLNAINARYFRLAFEGDRAAPDRHRRALYREAGGAGRTAPGTGERTDVLVQLVTATARHDSLMIRSLSAETSYLGACKASGARRCELEGEATRMTQRLVASLD